MKPSLLLSLCLFIAVAAAALAAPAMYDPSGTSWTGGGTAAISVKGIGKGKVPQDMDMSFKSGTGWTATDGDYDFSGTYMMSGPKTALVSYDPAGNAELADAIESLILYLSGLSVDVTVVSSTGTVKFKAKDGVASGAKYSFTAVLSVSYFILTTSGKLTIKGGMLPY